MVPTDYRLDHVVARLIERLEGTRRSHSDPDRAEEEFERIAVEHVDAALAEARELLDPGEIEHHGHFLRYEVVETFLPRYTRMASAMTSDEEQGHGLGRLATPVGRLVLVGFAAVALLVLFKFLYLPVVWPLMLVALSVPFWPDLVAMLRRRGYRKELESMLSDMTRIQDQADVYARPEELGASLPREGTGAAEVRREPTPTREEAP